METPTRDEEKPIVDRGGAERGGMRPLWNLPSRPKSSGDADGVSAFRPRGDQLSRPVLATQHRHSDSSARHLTRRAQQPDAEPTTQQDTFNGAAGYFGAFGRHRSEFVNGFRVANGIEHRDFDRGSSKTSSGNSTLSDRPRTRSPEEYRHSTGQWLNRVPEDAEMTVEQAVAEVSRSSSDPSRRHYGSVGYPASLEVEEEDDLSEEEEEWILDEELAKEGLYRGNYRNLVWLYTFVPLTTLLVLVILGLLPIFAFRASSPSAFPYPPYLPFPLPELFTAAAFWSLSYLLRDILYAIPLFLTSLLPSPLHRSPTFIPVLTSIISAFLQSASTLISRQLAIPILLIPLYSTERPRMLDTVIGEAAGDQLRPSFPTWHDGAFQRVWWIALGWAAAEAVVGIKQGYENIALYKDVLVSVHRKAGKTERTSPVTAIANEEARGRAGSSGNTPVTPTQRDTDTRRRSHSEADGGGALNVPGRRDYSDSLSSSVSGAAYEDLSGSAILGERQPLLALKPRPPPPGTPLTRRTTEESQRLVVENEVEQDLEELMHLKNREELEEVYGIPFIRIPVFISCLHRVNSILSSLGACLILAGAYMRSTLAYAETPPQLSDHFSMVFPALQSSPSFSLTDAEIFSSAKDDIQRHPFRPTNRTLVITFTSLLVLQTLMSVMHTPWILPRIGIHTFVYVGLLVWLGVFFAALGFWEVLS